MMIGVTLLMIMLALGIVMLMFEDDLDVYQVVGTPQPEKFLLRVLLVRFRQRGISWCVISAIVRERFRVITIMIIQI